MSDVERPTQAHYGRGNLGEAILAALAQMGKDLDALALDDLAAVDAFHVRGREATRELGRLGQLGAEHHVLDVGCGLGGSARYLAAAYGCRVTGLDLTAEYVQVATQLTQRTGLSDRVHFRQGSALQLPFEDATFDRVWSEHAQMNIPDKPRLYGEIHRVLGPGGCFMFHDILEGPTGEPHYPTPWASDPSHSALIDPAGFRILLRSLGFDVRHWEDKTVHGREWFRERVTALKAKGPPALGLHLLLGPGAQLMQENILRNLEEERIVLVQGAVEKSAERTAHIIV